jgi:hypothetical protein
MKRYIRIPLLFLFAGSVIGVVLRAQVIFAFPFINYTNLLHGHSHIMFLGWVFNALFIAFVINYIEDKKQRMFRILFVLLQVLNIGMLIAFPLQGYAALSIAFSTLHTLLSFVFILIFFRHVSKKAAQSVWLAKIALGFCTLSALGPFSLAYLVANGMQTTKWYNYAIYFYLHFQYNGFFFFGTASLFVHLLEKRGQFNPLALKGSWRWLIAACFPTYFLSILYSQPATLFNLVGAAGAFMQLYAYTNIFQWIDNRRIQLRSIFGNMFTFLKLIAAAIALKFGLQLLSAVPAVADMAYAFRSITIGYLHLVLLGIVSAALLVWYHHHGFFTDAFSHVLKVFFWTFTIMEIILVVLPWWPDDLKSIPVAILFLSAIALSACCLGFLFTLKKTTFPN